MLLPMLPRPRPLAAATIDYLTTLTDTVDATSFTFSGVSIGAAHSKRVIVLGLAVNDDGTPPTVTLTVTIGGITATRQIGANSNRSAIYAAVVPTGTTADIVVSGSETMTRCVVIVWRVVPGVSTTIIAADTADASLATATISALGVRNKGVVVLFAASTSTQTYGSPSWSGSDTFSERANATLESVITYGGWDASITEGIIAGNMSLSGTNNAFSIMMASWR